MLDDIILVNQSSITNLSNQFYTNQNSYVKRKVCFSFDPISPGLSKAILKSTRTSV